MFNWLKKKDKIKPATWSDITLDKFYELQDILSVQDEYTLCNLIDLVYGIDSADMPVSELSKYTIEFLSNPIDNKNVKLEDIYTINGRKYSSNINLTSVTTAQFIDYSNYCKEENKHFEKLLSVFFIPEGHNYNDGYNMSEVQQDLLQLDIVTVQSLAVFMIKQFQLFALTFQQSLVEELKTMNLTPEKKQIIEETLKLMNLGYSQSL